MSILARIRANGGEVVRKEWRFSLQRGRLSQEAIDWVRARWIEVCREVWPLFDDWLERAAIIEFDGGLSRQEAEAAAWREIEPC